MKLKVNAKLYPQFTPLALVCREMRESSRRVGQSVAAASLPEIK